MGLLSRLTWSAANKAVLLLALAGVKAVGEAFLAGDFSWTVVYSIVVSVAIAVAVHFGLYKPETANGTSVAEWAAVNGRQ